MNLKQYLINEGPRRLAGRQRIYRFPNGYGASVIDGTMAHLYPFHTEIAVIKFMDKNSNKFKVVYDTPITNDVIVTMNTVEELQYLIKIKDLRRIKK